PYTEATFRPLVQQMVQNQFSFLPAIYQAFGVPKETVEFLKEMNGLGVQINIISKNRREFIEAVLFASGFEKVQNIKIWDVFDLQKYGSKGELVKQLRNESPSKIAVVCDDDPSDFKSMQNAISTDTQQIFRCMPTGKFDWKNVLTEVHQAVNKLNTVEKSPPVPQPMSSSAFSFTLMQSALSNFEEKTGQIETPLFEVPPTPPKHSSQLISYAGSAESPPQISDKKTETWESQIENLDQLKSNLLVSIMERNFRLTKQPEWNTFYTEICKFHSMVTTMSKGYSAQITANIFQEVDISYHLLSRSLITNVCRFDADYLKEITDIINGVYLGCKQTNNSLFEPSISTPLRFSR
ncbi:MAG TPA: HAD family hydrolase, partial [Gammaproteobacteria bacterium]|nr:HAD family hydrolase [Gammaproteobacteria bacterium]